MKTMASMTYQTIYRYFIQILQIDNWEPPISFESEFSAIATQIGEPTMASKASFIKSLCPVLSDKLSLYAEILKRSIDYIARDGIFLNYHEKLLLQQCINKRDLSSFKRNLQSRNTSLQTLDWLDNIRFYTDDEILAISRETIRKDEKRVDIINSVFSCLLYSSFIKEDIDKYYSQGEYGNNRFYDYLKEKFPSKYDRGHAASILYIDTTLYNSYATYEESLSAILSYVQDEFKLLQNYCFAAILIDDIRQNGESITWRLYSDIVLFACKFIEEKLTLGYFHPDIIEQKTADYIPSIDVEGAEFRVANTGFTYKDCIVISKEPIGDEGEHTDKGYSILLLFQKNERDEDVIPCPACKSTNVRGNSYPSLGVKSWECNNPLCPDKSKYNRGKRYSMASIIKQEAIEDDRGYIEKEYLSEWRLDVVNPKSLTQIVEYVVKEYSFVDDTIVLTNLFIPDSILCNRKITCKEFDSSANKSALSFFNSAYFKRFAIENNTKEGGEYKNISKFSGIEIYNGDCRAVLSSVPSNYFVGAITSPPYYNAKEYSHWDNIYCYLYDMYNHAREVYRTLKGGGYYLYNIFDYFDNERNVVFSEMGKSRMILGAYIIYLFRKIGFKLQDNVIWYKGHIQGHRSTNQGNNSPYYQAPLNCYEHILCFKKPGEDVQPVSFPSISNIYPVIKMIRGENVLGHSAPFPTAIPDILLSRIKEGVVLEPYAGSFTTARAAKSRGISSFNIELSKEYCDLGMKLLSQQGLSLF